MEAREAEEAHASEAKEAEEVDKLPGVAAVVEQAVQEVDYSREFGMVFFGNLLDHVQATRNFHKHALREGTSALSTSNARAGHELLGTAGNPHNKFGAVPSCL